MGPMACAGPSVRVGHTATIRSHRTRTIAAFRIAFWGEHGAGMARAHCHESPDGCDARCRRSHGGGRDRAGGHCRTPFACFAVVAVSFTKECALAALILRIDGPSRFKR